MATYPYAGFWWRFVALLIDGLIVGAGFYAVDFVVFVAAGFANMPEGTDVGVNYVINVVGTWLYFALQESSAWQATIGKRCCRIFVTDIHGQRISFGPDEDDEIDGIKPGADDQTIDQQRDEAPPKAGIRIRRHVVPPGR